MALRKRKRAGGGGHDEAAMPSLTSLLDVVTVLLVFLMKSFAVSPIEVKDPSVHLPFSTSQEAIKEEPVIILTGIERLEGPPGQQRLVRDVPMILLDDKVVARLDPETYRIPADIKQGQFLVLPLYEQLVLLKKNQDVTGALTDKESSSGRIIIVADEKTPYPVLMDIMVTAARAGFGNYDLAIVPLEA